jgi:rhodanese-related sulfurtransferase
LKAILLEAILVAGIGLVLAFAANDLSPRGLRLSHDFFPGSGERASELPKVAGSGAATPGSNSTQTEVVDQLRQQGLQVIESSDAARLFRDPAHESVGIVFVDARDDAHYQAGHIPGAYAFDHYHAEKYFASVLPVCLQARQVIVYCHGGDCEDSRFAAIILRDAGIPKEKLYVFVGGITEWEAKGLPVETGARKSADLVN